MIKETFNFLKGLALNPRKTGAILPSSKFLANNMASLLSKDPKAKIIELGAGTGVVTEAILKSGISPKQLQVIEFSSHFVSKLKKRFPNVDIIEGDARELASLLNAEDAGISDIISGLPLRALPMSHVETIYEQIESVLSKKGQYIQFTYDLRANTAYQPQHFIRTHTTFVWRNVPPAKVEVFQRAN